MRISDWSSDVCSSDLPAQQTSMSMVRPRTTAVCLSSWQDYVISGRAQSWAWQFVLNVVQRCQAHCSPAVHAEPLLAYTASWLCHSCLLITSLRKRSWHIT